MKETKTVEVEATPDMMCQVCELLGLDPLTTVSVSAIAGQPVYAEVIA